MSLLSVTDGPGYWDRQAYLLGGLLKAASDGPVVPSYALSGLLYVSEGPGGPWGLLAVPNALVRGAFDALDVTGAELPLQDGKLSAHISVFRSEELKALGGPEAIRNDRGKKFSYSLGRLIELVPDGWAGVSRVWAVRVHSPELQALRRSYGLSGLPNDGKYDFHITIAVLRRGVLGRNATSKDTTAA